MTDLHQDDSCKLCQLVRGDLPTSRVHEDEHVIAFMDNQPVTPGHVLVVTRQHTALLDDLDEDLGAHLYRVAHRLSRALRRSGLRCEGVNLFLADGAAAFQEIPHVHMHAFPRYAGDAFKIDADWRVRPPAELDEAAALVRNALQRLADEHERRLRLVGVSLDCADPTALASFYQQLLGGDLLWDNANSAGVSVPGVVLVAQRVPVYVRPVWPGTSIVHLDLSAGSDLDEPEAHAVRLGAVPADSQPDQRWRVLLDPAGHPFCITTVTSA